MDRIKNKVTDYRKKFFKEFFIIFGFVLLGSILVECCDLKYEFIKFDDNNKLFEILVSIIGFLGILLGFMLTALGVIISGIQNRLQNVKIEKNESSNDSLEKNLNDYWKYLVKVTMIIFWFITVSIILFFILLSLQQFIISNNIIGYTIIFSTLLTVQITYMIIDRIPDYYTNPFENEQ